MLPAVGNPSHSQVNTSGEGNVAPRNLSSNEIPGQPTEENLQADARQGAQETTFRRRGRRRGRRRRRGQQRARARARAREGAQIAMAEMVEDTGSSDEENLSGNGSAGSRSRSPRRRRSLDNEALLRGGFVGIGAPTTTPPELQPSPCRVPNCDWSGPLDAAAQHARTTHQDAILRGPCQRLSVPLAFAAYTRYWRLIDAFDELFLVQFRRRAGSRRRLQAAVQLVGPASRATSFLYYLQMQVVESQHQTDPITSMPQPTTKSHIPPLLSTTRISLILRQTSSTRVDLEPAMISLWSTHNFSQPETSLENVSPCLPVLQTEADICTSTSAPRVLDLTLSIQQILEQKE